MIAREIEGELILVPLVAGIGDVDDELFTLNETGRYVWEKLDGSGNLSNILGSLIREFESSAEDLERDLLGFVNELLSRKMVIEV